MTKNESKILTKTRDFIKQDRENDRESLTSDSSREERADEGPINPIEEAKRLVANLATLENAKITRKRKIQTNPTGKNRSKTNFKCNQIKKK